MEQTGRPQKGGVGGYWEKLATEHMYITDGQRKQCGEVGGSSGWGEGKGREGKTSIIVLTINNIKKLIKNISPMFYLVISFANFKFSLLLMLSTFIINMKLIYLNIFL